MRIDAHVHYMPPTMVEDLANFSEREPYWGLLVAPGPGKPSVQGWATVERMIKDMDRAGLDKVILVGEYLYRHESCLARNDQAMQIVKRWPDRVIACATIQPKAGPKALDELRRCVEGGLRGVGELNPYAQGHAMNDPDFLRVVEACLDYELPLNLHVSEEVGHYYPGKSAAPLRCYYQLACRYPELKLILAHWGGGLIFYEIMASVRRNLKNVWYDTAASPLLYPTEKIFKVALECLDHRKILYGSDYPLRLYPRKQREPDFGPFIDEIDQLNLSPEVYADIMGNNAARLFGLPGYQDTMGQTVEQDVTSNSTRVAAEAVKIQGFMAVSLVAEAWPETQPIFEKFGIPWQDNPVPAWEPIVQAAAAHGWGPQRQQRLLDELNNAVSSFQSDL